MARTYKDYRDRNREARRRRITFNKRKQEQDQRRRECVVREMANNDILDHPSLVEEYDDNKLSHQQGT